MKQTKTEINKTKLNGKWRKDVSEDITMETKETQVSKTRGKVLNRNKAGNKLNKNLGFAAEEVFIIPYNACLYFIFLFP